MAFGMRELAPYCFRHTEGLASCHERSAGHARRRRGVLSGWHEARLDLLLAEELSVNVRFAVRWPNQRSLCPVLQRRRCA